MAGFPQDLASTSSVARDAVGPSAFPRPIRERETSGVRRAFPAEIDFLARQGAPPQALYAALGAARAGVTAEAALLGEGLMSEEAYYRALARHLRCDYYEGDPPFDASLDAVRALRYGVAPLRAPAAGPRAVIAPRGAAIVRLIDAASSGGTRNTAFAVASPQRLAALLRARRGPAIVADAADRLAPEDSARGGLALPQMVGLVAGALACAALAAVSPGALALVLSAALWLVFSAWIVLRSLAVTAADAPRRTLSLSDDNLPVFTVVAPLHREAGVVADLVKALDALDYPKCKLDIKLVVERGDDETLAAIARLRLPGRYDVIVVPPGAPTTKPRALDVALAAARGGLLVVYDAEDAPGLNQLRLAAERFAADPSLDCLQARLTIRNPGDSWLSRGIMAQTPQAA